MSSDDSKKIGNIGWTDLTVDDATNVRDFYSAVVGWTHTGLDMGGYEDYCMNDPDGKTVAGICHARGSNAGLPPQWMVYINVEDLDASLEKCRELGGEVIQGPRTMGKAKMAFVRDPAGAAFALYQP